MIPFRLKRKTVSTHISMQRLLFAGALLLTIPAVPVAAQSTVTGIVYPESYGTFEPPVVGGTYADRAFGSTVKRISDALGRADADRGGNLAWITSEYSTMSAFNSDGSRLILLHQSYFGLYNELGSYLGDLPLEITSSSEPRWSRKDNRTIYYVRGNQLKSYDISSGAIRIVRTFSEYSAISGMGESDISLDGDHFVFAGDRRHVFVYRISANSKSAVLDTGGRGFDSLYITPSNKVTITWNQSGTVRYTGIELFDDRMTFQRQLARAGGHMDVTLDSDGHEVLVWANAADPQPICSNAIVKIRIADGQQSCLASFDWSLAVHVSAPDSSGYVYVETYAPSNPTPASGWTAYANELLQIRLDGSQVIRLAHHRSRPSQGNTYNWQPRMSASRDGSRVVFSSNFDLPRTGTYPEQYSDVYLIAVGSPSPSPLPSVTPVSADPAPAPAPVLTAEVVRSEEANNPAVQLSGAWFPNQNAAHSGGSAILAMDAGSQASFTFRGTGVRWIGYRDEWSGIVQVYLDGELKGTIDTYSASTQAQTALYSLNDLSDAPHTLTLVVTGTRSAGSAGSWIWVDAFDVTVATVADSTGAGAVAPATPFRIEQNSPDVSYTGGTWHPKTASNSSGGSAVLSMDTNARATVTFQGTAVKWIGYRDQWSGKARVYVDGVLTAVIDTYTSPAQSQAVLHTVTGLAPGAHTLTIEVTGTRSSQSKGSWVWVDAFEITP
jgi:hypothetical protein